MNQRIVISIDRKLALAVSVAALILVVYGCSYLFFDNEHASDEDVIRVSIRPERLLPRGMEGELGKLLPNGVVGVILVSDGGEGQPLIFTPLGPDGKERNVCGQPQTLECQMDLSAAQFGKATQDPAFESDSRGTCLAGTTKYCHKGGGIHYQGKYPYKKSGDHFPCPQGCS